MLEFSGQLTTPDRFSYHTSRASPTPSTICWRAADGIFAVYFFYCHFRWMTKKVIRKENLEDRTKFFLEPLTKNFPPPPTFLDRPPTKIGRHNYVGAGLYLCLNIFSIGQAARGSAKNI